MENPVSDDVIAGLSDDIRENLGRGWLIAYPGRNPLKPVLRWSVTNELGKKPGAVAKGSGVSESHVDGANSRKSGYKRSKPYRQALEAMIPVDGAAEEFGSFSWLVMQGLKAAEGGIQQIKITCTGCGESNKHDVWKRPDANAIIKLIELVHGKAVESKEIDVNAQHIHALMQEGTDITSIDVFTVDPRIAEERREAIEAEAETVA